MRNERKQHCINQGVEKVMKLLILLSIGEIVVLFVVIGWLIWHETKRVICLFRGHKFQGKPYDCTELSHVNGESIAVTTHGKVDVYIECQRCGCMNPEWTNKVNQALNKTAKCVPYPGATKEVGPITLPAGNVLYKALKARSDQIKREGK